MPHRLDPSPPIGAGARRERPPAVARQSINQSRAGPSRELLAAPGCLTLLDMSTPPTALELATAAAVIAIARAAEAFAADRADAAADRVAAANYSASRAATAAYDSARATADAVSVYVKEAAKYYERAKAGL